MLRKIITGKRGYSLVEILVSVALIGIIGTGFLGALAAFSKTLLMTDIRQTAKHIAEAQLEYIRSLPYNNAYEPSPKIGSAYPNFTVVTEPDRKLHGERIASRNSNIQKLTVTVQHQGRDVYSLVGYKENSEKQN
jgi:prepilin-type N-terminal cleavage/methylation domain-containing protein